MTKTTLRSRGQLTLPSDVRRALHVAEGDDIAFYVAEDDTVTMQGLKSVPADQAWFWSDEWQAGEQEASDDIAAGRLTSFDGPEDMLAAWERERGHGGGADV